MIPEWRGEVFFRVIKKLVHDGAGQRSSEIFIFDLQIGPPMQISIQFLRFFLSTFSSRQNMYDKLEYSY